MGYKPFKMRGSPMKRNFGIGESEAPDAPSPINKTMGETLSRALAAGMATLPGGHDAYQTKTEEYERDAQGNLVLNKDGKPILLSKPTEYKPFNAKDAISNISDKIKGFFNTDTENVTNGENENNNSSSNNNNKSNGSYENATKTEMYNLRKPFKDDGTWDPDNNAEHASIQNKINELHGSDKRY